jgi:drug/metabolite transporter (DMT)-like permease
VRLLVLYSIVFAAVNAISVALTGHRGLVTGDRSTAHGMFAFLFNWRFITAMALALTARMLFVAINNVILSMPNLANSATSLTALITASSFPVILAVNALMLNERLTFRLWAGTALIMIGIFLACTKSSGS